ncbi:MAG: VOC family protein [Solirubrobacterales bacterium]
MSMSNYQVGLVLAVSDMDTAKDFYEGKLGLSPENIQDDVLREYRCGGGTGLTIYVSAEHAGKSTATLGGWVVDDLEKLMEELGAKGVKFERYDQEDVKTNEKGVFEGPGFKAAWFKDPDGNTHALSQTT